MAWHVADNGSKEFRLTRSHSPAFVYHRVSFDHRGKEARFGNVSDERNNVSFGAFVRSCLNVINAILRRIYNG